MKRYNRIKYRKGEIMKVLLINGSANKKGCTFTALTEVANILEKQGVTTEIIQIGNTPIRDCTGCLACKKLGNKCVYNDDIVNEVIEKAKDADGFIFGSPVYYAHPSGRILSLLDRAFYADKSAFAYKPGAAVVSARRAGTTASIDVLNKYFNLAQMPIVSSQYWNMVHGSKPEDVLQDAEGMQIMRTLGNNMAWIIKCIEAGKNTGIIRPEAEEPVRTNFIR